jgi:hypothetical protein
MGSFWYISTMEHSIRSASTSATAATCLTRSTDASYVGTCAANATSIAAGSATDVFFSADSIKRASCSTRSYPEGAYGHASYVAGRIHERLCLWTRTQKVSRGEFGSHPLRSVLEAKRMRFELLYQTFSGSSNHVDCLLDHPSRLRMNDLILMSNQTASVQWLVGNWRVSDIAISDIAGIQQPRSLLLAVDVTPKSESYSVADSRPTCGRSLPDQATRGVCLAGRRL